MGVESKRQSLSLEPDKHPQLEQTVQIQGKQFAFEVDTGAEDNFCSTDVWSELGKPLLYPVTGRYEVANRQSLPTLGMQVQNGGLISR